MEKFQLKFNKFEKANSEEELKNIGCPKKGH